MARFCVRRQVSLKGASEVNWNPASENLDALGGLPWAAEGSDPSETTIAPREQAGVIGGTASYSLSPAAAPVPLSLSLSTQVSSYHSLSVRGPAGNSPSLKNCTQLLGHVGTQGDLINLC